MFGVVFPTTGELDILRCPFFIEAQSRDSIPAEHTTNAFHYVSGQEIPGTEVQAPWTSYYAKLVNAPIAIANYGGVWFKTTMQNCRLMAIRPTRSELGVTHLAYQGMNLQALVDSGEPTPAKIHRQSRPPSRANSTHSLVEKNDTMPERSFMARGKRLKGTGDDPFGILDLDNTTDQPSVAATQPAVSRLTKPRLFSDSTGPTTPYLLELRLRLGHNFQSTQVDFFCLFFSFQNYILQHIKKHEVLLFYHVNIQCASYKLVTFIWTGLCINPAHMKSASLR